MMVARTFSVREIRLGAGFGLSIASLSTPGLVISRSIWSCCRYRTRLGCRPRAFAAEPPKTSSSSESRSLICKGSSSSASCSARSPVSLQREKSDPAESEEERRISGFSLLDDSSNDAEWSSKRCKEVGMLRRGILAGRKEIEEGIVTVILG